MNRFDAESAQWDQPRRLQRTQAFATIIREALPPLPKSSSRGMEFGCGTAVLGLELRDCFHSLLLVDSSAGMTRQVHQKLDQLDDPRIHALQWDVAQQPLPNTEVDVIFSALAFHHIRPLPPALANLHALLPTGGRLLVIDMDQDGGFWHQREPEFDGYHGFDREELSQWCQDAGFQVDSVTTVYEETKTMGEESRVIPLFLLSAEAM